MSRFFSHWFHSFCKLIKRLQKIWILKIIHSKVNV